MEIINISSLECILQESTINNLILAIYILEEDAPALYVSGGVGDRVVVATADLKVNRRAARAHYPPPPGEFGLSSCIIGCTEIWSN